MEAVTVFLIAIAISAGVYGVKKTVVKVEHGIQHVLHKHDSKPETKK
jgi:predicted DNA repair protein MutK